MVGIVIVSHSEKVAQGVVELCKQMAPDANILAAGGLPAGEIGTDFQRIYDAVENANQGDGVAIFFDMGSALMTTEMVLEMLPDIGVRLSDAPIVEGAVIAATSAQAGLTLDEVLEDARDAIRLPKLS